MDLLSANVEAAEIHHILRSVGGIIAEKIIQYLQEADYKMKAEENMVNLVKKAQESKKKILMSAMVAVLVILATVPLFVVAGILEMPIWSRILLLVIGFLVLAIGITVASILDREAGCFTA